MILALSCTKNWYYYLIICLYSILEHNKVKKIYLLLETDNINDIKYLQDLKNKYDVEFVIININEHQNKYLREDCPNITERFTNMSFSRLMLPDFVVEDKVLYLDTDTVVLKDISYVWNIDISDYYLIGVKDYGVLDYLQTLNVSGMYINSGFVVFNLKRIREENIVQKWFDIINTRKLSYPDQDAMNFVCSDKELYIPSMYNYGYSCMLNVEEHSLIKVIHYVGPKNPWVADKMYAEYWYDTEEKFLKEFVNYEND